MEKSPQRAVARSRKKRMVPVALIALVVLAAAAFVFWPRQTGTFGGALVDDGVDRIVIDPGHGGDANPGCVYGDVQERHVNLAIALKLRDILTERGYTVAMTREDETPIGLGERAEFANGQKADVFVSVHQNAVENNDTTSGIETWYNQETNRHSKKLAQSIQSALIAATGAVDRETIADTTLAVTRLSQMASCLVETGFLSATEERARLCDDAYQNTLATAIADGLDAYFKAAR